MAGEAKMTHAARRVRFSGHIIRYAFPCRRNPASTQASPEVATQTCGIVWESMMFDWFRKKRVERLAESVSRYVDANFREEATAPKESIATEFSRASGMRHGADVPEGEAAVKSAGGGRFSRRIVPLDRYDSDTVARAMRSLTADGSPALTLRTIEESTDLSFVDTMLAHISRKQLRDADVYKAAQVDRRLFSKLVSDRAYKPAKDTCVALCLALKLTLSEANDLLSRAGYTFSHSSKRDIILEYFFREQIYDVNDVNAVLFRLGQKPLGR